MRISSRRLGEFLVARRVLSRDDLEALLAREAAEGTHLSHLLLQDGLVSDRDLTAAVASELRVPYVELADRTILGDVWGLIPEQIARTHLAVALERGPDGISVAMADPGDDEVVDLLERELRAPVRPAVATREELEELVAAMYGGDGAPTPADGTGPIRLEDLLDRVLRSGASDLHLAVGAPPTIRVRGDLRRLERFGPLNGSEVRRLVHGMLTEAQRARFEAAGEIETSHALPGRGRFRVSAFVQRSSVGAVLRLVPGKLPDPEVLGIPERVLAFADHPRGLVVVCGPHGSGTSTTLAALVDRINRTRACHVMTVEDPIEFLHRHRLALVNQREVGDDVASIADGLRSALRQDPDVLVAGALPDVASLRLALAAAETGYLVLVAVRALDAGQAIERIIDALPAEERPQARLQLSTTLRGVVAQQLVPAVEGAMALAAEILLPTDAVLRAIRDDELDALPNAMVSGAGAGMRTMDQALAALVQEGRVSKDEAMSRALEPEELGYLLSSDDEPT
jgi:twitching motility protein PilT